MKGFRRFILKNWFWITLGCILQRKAIEAAYLERGIKTLGGEILVLPLVLLAVALFRDIFWIVVEALQAEDEDAGRIE